jgi:fructose-1,6-bisphosphatase/inositol monophosphatase family enzyme
MALTELEQNCIERFRDGALTDCPADNEMDGWVVFGLSIMFEAGRMLRAGRHDLEQRHVDHKADGSPTTALEHDLEMLLRSRLSDHAPHAHVIGEETGGDLAPSGLAIAIDPVDGTWAFLTGTETYATALTMFRDGEPLLGMIGNPTTGEIGYATKGGSSRAVVLSLFGEPDVGFTLPAKSADSEKILVNVHPSQSAETVLTALHEAWKDRAIQAVRSPGGSPSWGLFEAAKGNFVYVNLWSKRSPEPYDLAAGALLVRGAGGDVTGFDGEPIDALRHEGPFVAAVSSRARATVLGIVGDASSDS